MHDGLDRGFADGLMKGCRSRFRRSGWQRTFWLCILFSTLSFSASAHDWPWWRGPNHDGKSLDTGLLKQWPPQGPKLLWQATGIGKGYSSVSISGGIVYTAGNVGNQLTLFAFDESGRLLWKTGHDRAWTKNPEGSRSTPTVDGDRVYLLSGYGKIGCYNSKTGQPLWSRQAREFGGSPPHWGYSESVLIYENLAIFKPGGTACIVALDKRTGKTVWTTRGWRADPQYSSCYPFTFEGTPMIVTGTSEGLACVSPTNGRLLWYNTFSAHNTANCPTPVFSDGYVFWANGYGKGGICLKLSLSGGRVIAREAWRTREMDCHHGGYIIDKGYVYGNHKGQWVCLDLRTGALQWRARGVGKGSLCYADGMLYLFGEGGGRVGLATCSPKGLEMKGSFRVQGEGPSWAHPVVANGRLYLRYGDNLYCFDVRQS